MRLLEGEVSKLIVLSNRERFVSLTYGIGWVDLTEIPANQWAIDIVKKWRSQGEHSEL